MVLSNKNYRYSVVIPTYRLDLESPEDLVEEIARIYGYNNVPGSLPILHHNSIFIDKYQEYRNLIKSILINHGYQEIITYSLVPQQIKDDFCSFSKKDSFYQLLSPKNKDHVYYRQSIIPSHLKTIAYNLDYQNENLLFFEISKIHSQATDTLGEELLILSGTGKAFISLVHKLEQNYDFFWLKGSIERIFSFFNITDKISFSFSQAEELHPYQRADIFFEQVKIGFMGYVIPKLRKEYKIGQTVFVAQISLSKLFTNLKVKNLTYYPVSPFPKIEQDLAIVLNEDIPARQVIEIIKKNAEPYLTEAKVFDVYISEEYKKNKQKSLAIRLVFQSSEKTLRKTEIEQIMKKVISSVSSLLNAQIRE